jgi:hypothetical protein
MILSYQTYFRTITRPVETRSVNKCASSLHRKQVQRGRGEGWRGEGGRGEGWRGEGKCGGALVRRRRIYGTGGAIETREQRGTEELKNIYNREVDEHLPDENQGPMRGGGGYPSLSFGLLFYFIFGVTLVL